MPPVEPENPFAALLGAQPVVVLDGGLATALEQRGHDLATGLWSARLLVDGPDEIRAVHRAYLDAGADCVITASYQASEAGFLSAGYSADAARAALVRSVTLAREACSEVEAEDGGRARGGVPLVAASVGPYGAYLADGSEYVGRYGVGAGTLRTFHRERLAVLWSAEPDLMACETIPSALEADTLLGLLDVGDAPWAWLSFTCRDGERIADGTPFETVVRSCDGHPRVAAVGVNCTAPEHAESLVRVARAHTRLPIVVYPNSGERYDARTRRWRSGDGTRAGEGSAAGWVDRAEGWVAAGASIVGGCCRVGPETIAALRSRILDKG